MVLNRLLPFLNNNNIINKEQVGFRQNLSIIDSVADFTDLIYNCLDTKSFQHQYFATCRKL